MEFNVEIFFNIDTGFNFNVYFSDIEIIERKSMSMLLQTLNVYTQAFYGFESKLYLRRWVLYKH